MQLFRPGPAPIDKIQNRYRWRLVLKGQIDENFNLVCNELLKQIYERDLKNVRVSICVNPNNMV